MPLSSKPDCEPHGPSLGFEQPLAWPSPTSREAKARQTLDAGAQNLQLLSEGRGAGELPAESSDSRVSHRQIRGHIRAPGGSEKHLCIREL